MHILLTSLLEGKFKNRKNQIHLFDAPMFSVYIGDGVSKKDVYNIKRGANRIKSAFEKARQQIHSMGFGSMHANVLIKDLSNYLNQNTGRIGVGGLAYRKGKYMEIAANQFSSINMEYLVRLIVHEWAHLWMFNNSKEFKRAVDALYKKLIRSGVGKMQHKDVESATGLDYKLGIDLENSWSSCLFRLVFSIFHDPSMLGPQLKDYVEKKVVDWFVYKCREYQFNPTPELIEKVSMIANRYIFPKVDEIVNDPYTTSTYLNYSQLEAKEELYGHLWTNNDLMEPYSVQITSLFTQMYADKQWNSSKEYMSGNYATLVGKEYEFHRNYLKSIHNWVNAYGMSNNDEMWATGIEEFFKLPLPHRKAIIKLMMNMGAK